MRIAFFIWRNRLCLFRFQGSQSHGVLDAEKSVRETVDCLLTHFSFSFVTEEVTVRMRLSVSNLKSVR